MPTRRILTFAATAILAFVCELSSGFCSLPAVAQDRDPIGEMRRARDLLGKHATISAQLVETVVMFDRSVKMDGRYLQTADHRLRFEVKLRVGGTVGSLVEVCDGEILWSRQDIGKEQQVTRRNVKQILEAAQKAGNIPQNVLAADLGLGGLPSLLATIEQSFDFDGLKDDTLRDRPVVIIQGQWNAAMAANLRGQLPEGQLPPYVPDIIRITLDRETGFPHRIMYLKKVPERDTLRPLLTLDFLDVKLGEPIDPSEFTFVVPERIQPVELTERYLQKIQQPPAAPPTPPAGS